MYSLTSIKILLIDDEKNNRIVLKTMIQNNFPSFRFFFEADSIETALQIIKSEEPELVFLDVQLRNESGFDLLQQLTQIKFQVIFVTAHDNFAVKAFRFNAADYLLKPILATELTDAIEKAIKRLNTGNFKSSHPLPSTNSYENTATLFRTITINTQKGFIVINTSDIIYLEARNNYTRFVTTNQTNIIASQPLSFYEKTLQDIGFFRSHRSYIINLSKVKSYTKGEAGFITMVNDEEVDISRLKRTEFANRFNAL